MQTLILSSLILASAGLALALPLAAMFAGLSGALSLDHAVSAMLASGVGCAGLFGALLAIE